MAGTFKLITLVGVSTKSYEDAIQAAVTDAATSLRNLAWYEVDEMRGKISGDRIVEYQVKIRVAFKVGAP